MSDALVAFVRDRLDDDQAAILDHWDSDGRARIATMWTGSDPGYTTVASDHSDGIWVADGREVIDARHVDVLFDPARVLAQVAALRAIVDECETAGRHGDAEHDPQVWGEIGMCAATLRHLASIWSGHPEFDPAWAVDG